MIEVIIFYLHIIAVVYIFTKYWQNESVFGGFMGLALFGLMFSIGWVMFSFIVNVSIPSDWETGMIRKDSISLILLSIMESYFFVKFFVKDK